MKKNVFLLLIFSIFIFFCATCNLFEKTNTGGTGGTDDVPEEYFFEKQIIVKVNSPFLLNEIDALVPGERIKTIASFKNNTYVLYGLYENHDVEMVLVSLMSSGKVINAEKNEEFSLCLIPDDPYYSEYQYAPRITRCEDAWEIHQGDDSIVVAILDTGINGNHEDLTDRVIAGRDIIADTDIPLSSNSDTQGHGTHVAGIIGAIGNNNRGIAGVAWNIKLMPVKIFGNGITTTSAEIAEGMLWAIEHGAHVINMSLGGGLFSVAINDVVNYAHQNNVVLVAAMGNDHKTKVKYPAALPGIIAVGASNGRDEVAFFSTKGKHISVVAPGESIYSLDYSSDNGYFFASGTSMATPFIAGTAALLLSYNPGLVPVEVRSMIEDSADPLGPDAFSPDYGHGRVNVYNTLRISERNNYGSITVNVTNNGNPIGGVKVLIQDTADSTIIQAGFTSHGGMSGGVNGRIVFNHIRLGDYKVMVQVGSPQENDVTLHTPGENPEVNFAFTTSMVLLVNGIKKMDTSLLTDEYLYMRKLTNMGKYFSGWKVAYHGPPPPELLNAYDMVIWFTGRTRDDPGNNIEVLSGQEIAVIKNYLESGGQLFLCGNNIAESLTGTDPGFLSNYLHAQYLSSPLSHDELTGKEFLDGMYVIISMEDHDQIGLEPGAIGILDSSDEPAENHWAGLLWDTDYRLVFTSICPNEILYCTPNTFFEDIVGWLEMNN